MSTDIFEGPHVNFDMHDLPGAPERDAFYGRDVAIVSAPCQRNVAIGNEYVIRRIETDPAAARYEKCNPSMRGLSSLDFWTGSNITADVPSREPQ